MSTSPRPAPGVETVRPVRFVPRLHWELLVCGASGHRLLGTDARVLRKQDAVFAAEVDGVRWHRCLRCDSWLPAAAPAADALTCEHPPDRDEIELPLRGRPLRDRVILRLIAVDRALHFVGLALVSAAILVFSANRGDLKATAYRLVTDLQGGCPRSPTPGPACATRSTGCSRCSPPPCTCSPSSPWSTRSWRASRRSACGTPGAGRST